MYSSAQKMIKKILGKKRLKIENFEFAIENRKKISFVFLETETMIQR